MAPKSDKDPKSTPKNAAAKNADAKPSTKSKKQLEDDDDDLDDDEEDSTPVKKTASKASGKKSKDDDDDDDAEADEVEDDWEKPEEGDDDWDPDFDEFDIPKSKGKKATGTGAAPKRKATMMMILK
jgi:DNA-directed RNA polymerase subunit delta